MKKQILLFIVVLNAVVGFAQKTLSNDYSYTVSAPYKLFEGKKFYFSNNNRLLAVKIEERDVMLQIFNNKDEKVSFIAEKKYEDFPKNMQLEDVIEHGGRYYLFYSLWDGRNDKEQLFVREIDFVKGIFTAEAKLLLKVDGKVTGAPLKTKLNWSGIDDEERGGWVDSPNLWSNGVNTLNSLETTDKFDFIQDMEKKKLLVQYRMKPKIKSDTKSYDIIGMAGFDQGLTMTSQEEIKMPYTERRMDALDYAIDMQGNTYILAKVFHDDSNKSKKEGAPNYHIELMRLKNGSN
ncbi:hypothetical protein LRS05_03960 [Flavobacterium sp. J372]|uniref:hypothetical protein n=1 Tax=Flavobacterium sp. J372 TaxID=2898436 RepID=UPI002150721E|nr:hypothetical protein [Flavobacterium sp. J372]MCR5861355.1 hypothetical protein [Flavobacterium sp. J372]